MKNKKGFTLIELLAVIVILAVIALIAVPQVLKILNQARISAAEDSTYGIYNATQDYISRIMLSNGGDFPSEDLTFTCDTESCKLDNYAALSSEYNLEETLEYKGKKATGGKIKITNGGKDIIIENLVVSGFTCNYSNEKATCEKGGNSSGNNNTNTIGTLASNVHVGDYIEYDPTLGVSDTSKLSYTSPMGELKVKDSNDVYLVNGENNIARETYNNAWNLIDENGNFVTTGYTVEADNHGNGNSDQNFQATSSNNLWRVLDVNTTTGVVKIIPEYEIKTSESTPDNFYLYGLRGYKNAVTELNNISSIFGYGTGADGAHSITVEEVNNLTGYNPLIDAPNYNQSVTNGYINKSWKYTYYSYEGTIYPGTSGENFKIYEMLIKRGDSVNRNYWLASASVWNESNKLALRVRSVDGGSIGRSYLWLLDSNGNELPGQCAYNVLPVVTLKSDLNYKSGDGTSSASDKIIKFQ